ncbi:hypothetical protein [Mitsuaria sp. GD03876]|uniref:hypothetical protein n=1 Tax=Mitsuaria sp. GD03876 TaxID=2975399 RepID=UPI002446B565|nr:hypothetical protein [Mitsuaria sp. GD03876]MDH0868260.1 hypothetical protein [Mitsuaria sp. GD03876]
MSFHIASLVRRKLDQAFSTGSSIKLPHVPSDMSRAEAQAWKSRADEAAGVLQRMEAKSKGSFGALSPQAHLKHLLPPCTAFNVALRPLHAHLMPDTGHVLMDTPGRDEAHSWAANCLQHRIGRVIDLSPAGGHGEPSCMAGSKVHQNVHGGLAARFQAINLRGPRSSKPAAEAVKGLGKQATSTWVGVTLTHRGQAYRPAHDAGAGASTGQRLDWLRVPVKSGHAMGPAQLLAVCEHVRSRRLDSGERQAIHCPARDKHVGATLEAALMLRQRHGAGVDLDRDPGAAVADVCDIVREHRGPDLFRREDLMSLLEFTRSLKDLPRG